MSIKAQAILIVPGQSVNLGIWESTLALGQVLKKANKDYFIFVENQEHIKTVGSGIDNIPVFDANAAKDLVITLARFEDKVSDVKWEQTGQNVKMRLSTEKGDIGNPDIAISRVHNSFDLKIFVGLNKEEAQAIDSLKDQDFTEGKSVFLKSSVDTDIIPALVYDFIKKNKLKLDPDSAQKLLDGIYNATNNFTKNQSAQIFFISSKLMAIINRTDSEEKPVKSKTEDQTDSMSEEDGKLEEIETPILTVPEVKEPEELPPDYDPLAPATDFPQPLILEDDPPAPKPQVNSPLPEAQE